MKNTEIAWKSWFQRHKANIDFLRGQKHRKNVKSHLRSTNSLLRASEVLHFLGERRIARPENKKHNSILAQKTEETDSILQFTTKLLLDRFLDRCIKVWVVCICAHPQHKAVVLRSHFAAKYLKYCDRKLDKTAASFFSSVNCSCSCCECTANALTRDRVETRSVACIRFIVNQRNVGKHCCNLQCIGAMELQSTVVVRTYSFKLDFPSLCSHIYFQQPLKIILFVIPE